MSRSEGSAGRRKAGRLRTALPLMIAFVVLLELALRVAAPKLRDPLLWPDWEAQHKVEAMDAIEAKGRRADVVFVGSSMVNAGFDPARATTLLGPGRFAFNAALNGADLRSTSLWTRNVVVPRLRPKLVVVGFNAGEANDGRGDLATLFTRFHEAPLGRVATGTQGILADIDGWLVEHVYLARYRIVLRRPVDALIGHDRAQDTSKVGPLGGLLGLTTFQRRPYTAGLSGQLGHFENMLANYHVGGVQFAALQELADDLRARDIRLVLVRMPVTEDLLPHFPNGEADRRSFDRALSAFVAKNGLTLIDAQSRVTERSAFVDPLHLSTKGMQQLTEMVIAEL